MQKRLLKIAKDMRKVRKQLMDGEITRAKALAQARVADIEIRALCAAATI